MKCTSWGILFLMLSTAFFALHGGENSPDGDIIIGTEGSPVVLDAESLRDPHTPAEGYRWDFDGDGNWDTAWTADPIESHVWGDDHKGKLSLQTSHKEEIVDIKADGDGKWFAIVNMNHSNAQSFTPVHSQICKVKVDISINWGRPNAGVDVHIRKELEGPDLTNASVPVENIPEPRFIPFDKWPVFDFPDVSLVQGETYYLVVTSMMNAGGNYEIHISEDSYNNGTNWWQYKQKPWVEEVDGDLRFALYACEDEIQTYEIPIEIENVSPSLEVDCDAEIDEGNPVYCSAMVTDPGSDDLTLIWQFSDGFQRQTTHFNDENDPDPPESPWGTFPFEVVEDVTHIFKDDGLYELTLTIIDDDGGVANKTLEILVLNVPPSVSINVLPVEGTVLLRTAGEKWHDVSIELHEDDVLIAEGSLTRYPGSPNDQMLDLTHLSVNISRRYSAIVRYTPEDDPVNGQPNGANPCWIVLKFDDQEEVWIHHTFNVQHPETHIWEVDLTATILSHGLTFEATAHDPGADDLTFHWDFGDGTNVTNIYPNPNGSYPVTIVDTVTHAFPGSGTFTITVTVKDDDGGMAQVSYILTI